jgi:hypothetical protein
LIIEDFRHYYADIFSPTFSRGFLRFRRLPLHFFFAFLHYYAAFSAFSIFRHFSPDASSCQLSSFQPRFQLRFQAAAFFFIFISYFAFIAAIGY